MESQDRFVEKKGGRVKARLSQIKEAYCVRRVRNSSLLGVTANQKVKKIKLSECAIVTLIARDTPVNTTECEGMAKQ